MYFKKYFSALFITIILSVFFTPVFAQCMMTPVSLLQRATNSELIVLGKLKEKKCYWDFAHQNIFTVNIIQVSAYLKGYDTRKNFSGLADTLISVISEGGIVGNQAQQTFPSLSIENFGEYIFFLNKDATNLDKASSKNENTGILQTHTYASSQGVIAKQFGLYRDILSEPKCLEDVIFSKIKKITKEQAKNCNGAIYLTGNDNALRNGPPPSTQAIASFSPSTTNGGTIAAGDFITISGSGFGATAGTVFYTNADDGGATFISSGIASDNISWSATSITNKPPQNAGTGPININGAMTSASNLTVDYTHSCINSTFSGFGSNTRQRYYHVNKNGSGGYTLTYNTAFASNTLAKASFERALQTWRCATYSNIFTSTSTSSITSSAVDGVNLILFDATLPVGVHSKATLRYNGSSTAGCTLENTVWRVDEIDFQFASDPPSAGFPWEYGPALPSFTEYDFESAVMHEIGHALGLQHRLSAGEVMHFSIANGATARTPSATEVTGAIARVTYSSLPLCVVPATVSGPMIPLTSMNCMLGVPEINVLGNGLTIADGDLIPTTADHTDFGSVLACNGTITRTFSIQNLGTTDLNISNVVISGTNPTDFNVTLPPAPTVTAGSSSIFQVTFDPSATGMRSALITINNDDADEAVYDFKIQGTGNSDIVNPVISCPGNIDVNNDPGQCGAIVNYTAPIGTDNCPSSTTAQIAGLPSGSLFPVGVTVNTFRVTDGSGNTATCSFSVTVTDTESPLLYTMNCVSSNASALAYSDGWQTGDNDGSGFSSWVLTASGGPAVSGFLLGSSITNGAGIDSNGDQDINTGGFAWGMYSNSGHAAEAVRSLTSPLSISSSIVAEIDNGFVDNGQIASFIVKNSSGSNLCEVRYRGNQVGYELVDNNGITPFGSIPFTDEGLIIEVTSVSIGQASIKLTRKLDGATQTIISTLLPGGGNQSISQIKISSNNVGSGDSKNLYVNKLQVCSPSLGCPATISVSNDTGVCGTTVVYNSVLASDNCASSLPVIQTAGLPSGSVFQIGTTTNSFSVTDAVGHTATCSFNITVSDVEPPIAICRNVTVHLDNTTGTISITPGMIDDGSTDNCSIVSRSISPTSFNCSNIGPNTVTLTVTDAGGNSSICSSVVTVLDSMRPIANCYAQTIYLDNATGTINLVPGMIDNGSTDNCGIVSRSINPNSFTCANLGPNTVTLTVTDASGNSSTCTSLLTVLDSMRPTAICQNLTLYLNPPFATANIIPAMLNNGSFDNCGIASMSVSPNSVDCSNIGSTNVTLTVTDNSGNSSTCTSVVTVVDSIRPVANCQNITVTLNASGTASITGAMVDNGSTDLCGIASLLVSPNIFNCSNVGANNVVFTVTDINGNSATCNTIVTVVSDLSATITVNNHVKCFGGNDGQAIAIPSNGSAPYTYTWLPFGGTGATSTGLSSGTYTCIVNDVNGCIAEQTITISEPTVLSSASSATPILCNGGNAVVTVTGSGGTSPYNGTGNFTVTAGGPYSYSITDDNGCISATIITVTEPDSLSVSITSVTNPITCGGTDGTIDITVDGGTLNYNFLWSNADISEDLFNVAAGTYNCLITDANGCSTSINANLSDPSGPTVTLDLAIDSVCKTTTAPFILTGESPSGGSFSGSGVIGNTFDPMTVNIGFNVISYSFTSINGCTANAIDSIFVDACLGIKDQGVVNDFVIMPNPNNGTFMMQLNANEAASVMIYDALGKLISVQEIQPRVQQQMNILSPGVYFISVITNNGNRSIQRVVVDR
ncbi:MAG: HYR domain-containing protein [Bacteroidota bacterium]|nr:HYR domain-containing protein [Bacteroidota bacterium]